MHQPVDGITLKNTSLLQNEELIAVVNHMARDMKFFATCYIIYGVFISLTIFGAVIGIPVIIFNLKLRKSADQYRRFLYTNDFYQLSKAFTNQRKFFFFNKVLLIAGMIFLLLYIVLIVLFGLTLFSFSTDSFVIT